MNWCVSLLKKRENMGLDLGMVSGLAGPILGMALSGFNDRRQYNQQERLQNLQIAGNKEMTDYNMSKQLEMWKNTSYSAQMEQMKKAGINPGLMYGMGGGGGQSVGSSGGGVSGGQAPSGGREIQDGMGMMMQLQLLDAQKKNIEADTANKKMDTVKKDQEQYGTGLDNALKLYLQSTDEEGNDRVEIAGSTAAKGKEAEVRKLNAETQFRLDENDRQELMNDKRMMEIGSRISMMAAQTANIEEITNNLKKDGKLKDAEIAWNELGMKRGDFGKFILELIKRALFKR